MITNIDCNYDLLITEVLTIYINLSKCFNICIMCDKFCVFLVIQNFIFCISGNLCFLPFQIRVLIKLDEDT